MRREPLLLFLSPVTLAALVFVCIRAGFQRAGEADPSFALVREVDAIVERHYVSETSSEERAFAAARGIVSELDRHSRVYDDSEFAADERKRSGRYAGVGIALAMLDGAPTVLDVTPGGPADLAGLRAGDALLSIAGEPTVGARAVSRALKALQGRVGSRVRVAVSNLFDGSEREADIVRDVVPRVVAYAYALREHPGVGWLSVRSFRSNTMRQVRAGLEALRKQGVQSLILDLRGNRGGSLEASVQLADAFLTEGPIVVTRGRSRGKAHLASAGLLWPDTPLVVLVDATTASAAEVAGGALQDHARALLVGERTYGKGVVQEVVAFQSAPGGMKLTTQHHFTPSGRCIEKSVALPGGGKRLGGLEPDVWVSAPRGSGPRLQRRAERGRYDARIAARLAALDGPEAGSRDEAMEVALALLGGGFAPDRRLVESEEQPR